MEKLALHGGTSVRKERLPIFRLALSNDEIARVIEVLRSGQIARGPLRDLLASEFCRYTAAHHAVVVSSGTAALHVAIRALNLEPKSEVIVPSLSFIATAFAVEYSDLVPIFAEVSEDTLNISPADIERKISPRTRAILPVHFAGQVADLTSIYQIACHHGLAIIEDAAHAIGASHEGKKIGTSILDEDSTPERTLACFSLFATKNMTSGEGGIITTKDPELHLSLQRMRAHGIVPLEDSPRASGYYDVVDIGYNYHLSDINIALALEQLKRLDELNRTRRDIAKRLSSMLRGIDGVILPHVENDHVFHIYSILLDLSKLSVPRDTIVSAMLAEGIQVGLYYRPIHLFSYFRRKYGHHNGLLPTTEKICEGIMTLPMHPLLSESDLVDIATALKKVLRHFYR